MSATARVAWASVGFAALVQLLIHAPRIGWTAEGARFLGLLPFVLLGHVVAALLLAALHRGTRGAGRRGAAFWIVWVGYQSTLIADLLHFRLFERHLHWWTIRGEWQLSPFSLGELPAALVDQLGLAGALAALALVGLTAWVARGADEGPPTAGRWRRGFAAYAVVSAVLIGAVETGHAARHPLVTLAASMARLDMSPPAPYSQLLGTRLYALRFGEPASAPGEADALAAARSALRRRTDGRPADLLLVILESVGTNQLLAYSGPHKGRVSPRATPFIAELSKTSVRFDSLYASFPASARSHISMMSGGPTITWGGYQRCLDHAYTSPNLISELRDRGYRTAVVATGDLNVERMGDWYRWLGPDAMLHYNDGKGTMRDSARLNYWGVHSDEAARVAVEWVSSQPKDRPLALIFMTVETHYPYDWPASHTAPLEARSMFEKYYNALHYTDAALRRLVEALRASRGDHWVVALTGDHGEAFGKRHRNNLLHRNHLYEENVREFLIIADPRRLTREVVSHRVGGLGDVGPTLLSALDDRPVRMPGHDLFDPDYRGRIAYFHKITDPYKWGLRDGRWKFISTWPRKRAALYDLDEDPLEQTNLAERYPRRVRLYHELCATWYLRTGYDFIARLRGFPAIRGLRRPALDRIPWGAQRLTFGRHPGGALDPDRPLADPSTVFAPADRIAWRVQWAPWRVDKPMHVLVRRLPDGEAVRMDFVLGRGLRYTVGELPPELGRPLEPGRYALSLHMKGSAEPLIRGTFDVHPSGDD